ncbi:nicotinate-nucleotide adenylyltransferase [Dongia sp.]|uniref:nicotinate-nucleotide adenylyltransferase n=1 Tax=Dongia sp. TaxID=1977262 RepID=UPI0035B10B62
MGTIARKIGILGGSFNPAHGGHRDISLAALSYLGLDEIWWLVAPQNPLKSPVGMAPLDARLAEAQRVAGHPRIRVSDLELRLGTTYTADTLKKVVRKYPHFRFVWLMGADNLASMARWKDWQQIFHLVPIAVFDRPTYTYRALAALAARRFACFRAREQAARTLVTSPPPAWTFVHHRLNPISATEIRSKRIWGESGLRVAKPATPR